MDFFSYSTIQWVCLLLVDILIPVYVSHSQSNNRPEGISKASIDNRYQPRCLNEALPCFCAIMRHTVSKQIQTSRLHIWWYSFLL